jgi:hypothetical protein
MEITDVYFEKDSGQVIVTAVLEDKVLTKPQTWDGPAEYGPATCTTSFFLEDVCFTLDDEEALEEYLQDAEWEVEEEEF